MAKKNSDDNRPLCLRCEEPIVYGQSGLHNQYCKTCGAYFCFIHECKKQAKKGGLLPTHCMEITTRIFTNKAANLYDVKEHKVLMPYTDEALAADTFIKLVRNTCIQEFIVKISK